METYALELEEAEGRFIGTVRAVPGLLVFGSSVDEVLERARSAIDFHLGQPFTVHEAIRVAESTPPRLRVTSQT